MTVLVTGAAGYIGRNFLRAALSEDIVGIDAVPMVHGPLPLPSRRVSFERVDLLNPHAVLEVMQRAQPRSVIHLAAHSASGGNPGTFQENALMTLNVLLAARRLRTRPHIVIAGSAAEYGETQAPVDETHLPAPRDAYGFSKVTTTLMAIAFGLEYGLPVAVLRFGNVYGPGQAKRFVPYMVEAALTIPGKMTLTGSGRPIRPWLYVADAVTALRWATTAEGVFNVAESNHSLHTVAKIIVAHACDEMLARGVAIAPQIELSTAPGGIERLEIDSKSYLRASNNQFVNLDQGLKVTVADAIREREHGN